MPLDPDTVSKLSAAQIRQMLTNDAADVPVDPGVKALPGHGQPTWQAPDGSWLTQDAKTGKITEITDPGAKAAMARTKLVLPAMVKAQQDLYTQEGWAGGKPLNPYNLDPAANVATAPASGGVLSMLGIGNNHAAASGAARQAAPDAWQTYDRAAKSMQDLIMPLLQGLRQAQGSQPRIIDSYIPQPGDHPIVLSQKALARAQLINSAANQLGQPSPFPRADTEHHYADYLAHKQVPAPAAGAPAAAPGTLAPVDPVSQ